ncbi:hypothetical protein WR25_23632 [Diploscapter pachys]|uniref:Uncharacterized protein n=1 Tax=Diploscapter pachys TaxID=2018661 RepID=A0A2A2J742_9BILA|nr:hypothetical protein WR25_23632 [Diploscapter pachys]
MGLTRRSLGELGAFAALIVSMHFAYYTIQRNDSLVAPDQRRELFYVRWLKEAFPSLKQYGVVDEGPIGKPQPKKPE